MAWVAGMGALALGHWILCIGGLLESGGEAAVHRGRDSTGLLRTQTSPPVILWTRLWRPTACRR